MAALCVGWWYGTVLSFVDPWPNISCLQRCPMLPAMSSVGLHRDVRRPWLHPLDTGSGLTAEGETSLP